MKVKVQKKHRDAIIPQYKTKGAACFDLASIAEYVIEPGATVLIGTGLAFAVPEGYEMQIRPRSGVSLETDLHLKNSPGTVDEDYTGEVFIIAANRGAETIKVEKFQRIAQASISPVYRVEFEEVLHLDETERGAGGFGSTGKGN